jgi:hypothetical protein
MVSPLALRRFAVAVITLIVLSAMLLAWSALASGIDAGHPPGEPGASVPDGFSVWHHLDANGIRFKSITPQDDVLLIKFDSRAQSAAAKVVSTVRCRTGISLLSRKMTASLQPGCH